jgi:hypothetical protein
MDSLISGWCHYRGTSSVATAASLFFNPTPVSGIGQTQFAPKRENGLRRGGKELGFDLRWLEEG